MYGWKGLFLGRVKQGNYHTHVLYTIPNPNYTLPKPYPFIITYPSHHTTLGTQTGRVFPCASINTTLPWIPTYPHPFRTKNELRLSNLSIQHCLKLISKMCNVRTFVTDEYGMSYFCPYLCYIRKCNMAEPMLPTKILYLSVSALFFFFYI